MTSTSEQERSESGRGASVIVNVLRIIRCFTVEEPQQGVTEIVYQPAGSGIERELRTFASAAGLGG